MRSWARSSPGPAPARGGDANRACVGRQELCDAAERARALVGARPSACASGRYARRRSTRRRPGQPGGWQESRTIRCGRTLASGRGVPSGCSSIAAEMRPVSRVSRRTEVNGGQSRDASGLSS